MIALLLATQITAAALPQGLPLDAVLPPRGYITPLAGPIRGLPAKSCAFAGRLETSFAKPIALYRSGDRPPKTLKHWVDYPEARLCAAEAAP